jgi:hypothetical protein
MLTKTLLRIPFSVIDRCSLVPTSHWLQRKRARIHLSQAASGMFFKNHRRLPVSIFSVKIAALGFLKRYWKDFRKEYHKISKEHAKTMSLIFSSTKKQKILKTISACTESTYKLL